jgi:hypothetical protein
MPGRRVKFVEQRTKAGWAHATNQHATAPASFRQTACAPHATMAVHVRDHDDHVGALDEGGQGVDATARQVPRMTFDGVPSPSSEALVMVGATFDAADESNMHDFARKKGPPAVLTTGAATQARTSSASLVGVD